MKKLTLLMMILLVVAGQSFSQSEKQYERKLKKLFNVSGSEETFTLVIEQTVELFKQQSPGLDEKILAEIEKEFLKTSMDDLIELLVPVYRKYFTLDDIKELIAFYKSPIGRKFAEMSPKIVQESMQVGAQWGLKISQELEKTLKKKGYL